MFNSLNRFYVIELLVSTAILYLTAAFIHLSIYITDWSVYTRITLAAIFISLFLFSQYIAAMKGLRK